MATENVASDSGAKTSEPAKPASTPSESSCPKCHADLGEHLSAKELFEKEYPEICSSYHGIREYRAKLFGFLPLASSGIFLLLKSSGPDLRGWPLVPIGIYGVAVSAGLYLY